MRHVLVFDLDDTLYPERQFALGGFAASARWAETTLGIEPGLADEMTRLLDAGHLGTLFPLVLKSRVPEHTAQHLAEFVAAYRDHTPDLALFEDAAWALQHYAAQGPLGLITDGSHGMQERKVAALGIAPRFREIVYTGALGGRQFHKPHPLSYEKIEATLGGAGTRLVYIGDNPSKDFVVPNARGWLSIMIQRPDHARIHAGAAIANGGAPQATVASLTELPRVLEK